MSNEQLLSDKGRSDTIPDVPSEIGVQSPTLDKSLVVGADSPRRAKRPRLEDGKSRHRSQRAKSMNEGYITPGNTSETMSSTSSGSSSNSVSSSTGGPISDEAKPRSNSDGSDDVAVVNNEEHSGDLPNREFLRQEPPRVSHAHHHPHYTAAPIQFPAAAPTTEYHHPSPRTMMTTLPRIMSIEPTQLPLATVAVPIPGPTIPAMPQFQPMVHPPILPTMPISPSETSSQSSGTPNIPAQPALHQPLVQPRLPPPQQIVPGFDPAYSLAFHYHFYPPGVSFYPVGIPTGIPGIVFPGTLNHGLYQVPQTAGHHALKPVQTASPASAGLRLHDPNLHTNGTSASSASGSSSSSGSGSALSASAYPPAPTPAPAPSASSASMGGLSSTSSPTPLAVVVSNQSFAKQEQQTNSHSKRQYQCPYDGCEWSFSRASDQRRHIKSHEKPLLQCPFWTPRKSCHRNSGAFNRLDVLKRHLRLVHFQPITDYELTGSTAGKCRHCRVDFDSVKDFVNHCNGCAAQIYSSSGSSGSSGGSSESGASENSDNSESGEF